MFSTVVGWVGRLGRGLMLAFQTAGRPSLYLGLLGLVVAVVGWALALVPATIVPPAEAAVEPIQVPPMVATMAAAFSQWSIRLVVVAGALLGVMWAVSVSRPALVAAYLSRRGVRREFPAIARSCGLSEQTSHGDDVSWRDPRLVRVRSEGGVVVLRVKARRGQSATDLDAAGESVASSLDAATFRVVPVSPSVVEYRLTLVDGLVSSTSAFLPADLPSSVAFPGSVVMGRSESGGQWVLPITGVHTLVAGRSGSGKGSILWGVVGSLAPWIARDVVRVWAVDLKRGVEVAMGDGLMYRTAYRPEAALAVMRDLLAVIDERASGMVGQSRLHVPTSGDPLHLLVIDELAALTAYADAEVKKEGNRLLAEILTQGRALGVVVLACVQDPKKETVPSRGLFTQTVALRLASSEETRMVLGDGASSAAPAQRIPRDMPGVAYVVTEDGSVSRVRAHYWSDPVIRATAERFPSAARWVAPLEESASGGVAYVQSVQGSPSLINASGVLPAESGVVQEPARRPRRTRRPAVNPEAAETSELSS